ncbi:prolyl oligopeptidase family serine peptidase [Niveibacterium umoris]|uniref:Prolyl oligopeptidase n=1 Tax=Niveibacterium umoris TaxID=1193620 RepID=A0A840BLQ6_9RHOO|nr:prolyl oligopeptidase family serine peptidase [Niveibacterium umoris]MBB4013940.1 prolyl oligopeptidase [Niveibacterium umoris]
MSLRFALSAVFVAAVTVAGSARAADEDPYQWLEAIDAPASLDWVRARNAETLPKLEQAPGYAALHQRLLGIYNSPQRLVPITLNGAWAYNFWQDAEHPRGIWRRTALVDYRKGAPKWETVLDVDALGRAEGQSWVWKGADCLGPEGERCLISLSPGGGDAVEIREFDTQTSRFVDGGFRIPTAKSGASWVDRNTLIVGTDFGPGSLTDSGYARVLKRWKRGTPLAQAQTVFEARKEDMLAYALLDQTQPVSRSFIVKLPTFFTEELYALGRDGKLAKIDKPDSAKARVWRDRLILELRDDWTRNGHTFMKGSLLALPLDVAKARRALPEVLFVPDETVAMEDWHAVKDGFVLDLLDKVRGRVLEVRRGRSGWVQRVVPVPALGDSKATPIDPEGSNDYLLTTSDYLTPSTLSYVQFGKPGVQTLQQLPAFFDASGLEVAQYEATSRDGTRVPYFIVAPKGAPRDGSLPTVLYGYGGFEIAMTPGYNGGVGAGWLERGGAYVVANIRGGGEFGPRWHAAALKEKRQNAYDDFIAVAEDLIRRGVTSPKKLAIMGGSNGGLLVGATEVQRPDLFAAVVCQVPLLDMKRYHQLLAGASWMGEYGNPDIPEEWAYISKYSPYQNLKPGVSYPRTLFVTSTRDDRVHPGHARKMAARMREFGQDVWYFENMEGGHAGAADNTQRARMWALTWTFLDLSLR